MKTATMPRGRPKLDPSESRSTHVRIRVTKAERAAIMRKWKKAKAESESAWIRKRLLEDD